MDRMQRYIFFEYLVRREQQKKAGLKTTEGTKPKLKRDSGSDIPEKSYLCIVFCLE